MECNTVSHAIRARAFGQQSLLTTTIRFAVRAIFAAAIIILNAAVSVPAVNAAGDFYKGKTITVLIPFQAGSGYDTYARAFGRHVAGHIPGSPTIVPSNMLGGGGLVLANYLYNVAPKDGTVIALLSRSNLTDAVISNPVVKFDPRKFNWLGTISDEVSMCVAWHSSGFKTWEDVTKKEFIATASGATADNGTFPLLFNEVLGTKYKVVVGYKGGPAMNLAIERGEAHGRCGWSWTAVKTIGISLVRSLIVTALRVDAAKTASGFSARSS